MVHITSENKNPARYRKQFNRAMPHSRNQSPALTTQKWLKAHFYRPSAQLATQSPVLATIGLSVRPSVCHTLALSENEASYRITKSSRRIAQVFGVKIHPEIPKGSPRARALNESGVGKIRIFSQ